jgi:exocyst complex component 6
VSKLNALLLTLFERYAQLLRFRFSEDFQQAVKETDHQPMVVNNSDELRKVLNVCWLRPGDADELRKQPFPLTLPFSQTYPLCCMDIRHLVDEYYTFSEGFSQHHRDIDDILKQSLDELLIQQVSSSIRSSLEKTSNLSQIAQIVVNAEHFKLACTELEALLVALRAPARGGKLRLDASPHFDTSLQLAQKRINTATAAKLVQFLDLEEYNMTPSRPRLECADHLSEMLAWLTTMMESVLSLLPPETKRVAYKNAFKYIAEHLMKTCLLSERETKINEAGLRNLELDVEFLQRQALEFADKDVDFGKIYSELKQVSVDVGGQFYFHRADSPLLCRP